MKSKLLFSFLLLIVCASMNAQTIADPVSYCLKEYRGDPGGKLLKVQIDFTKDGKKSIFIALVSSGDKSGYLWIGFKPVEGGYARIPVLEVNGLNAQGAVKFRDDALYNGYISELKTYGIISYAPDNETGALTATVIQDGALKQTTLKRIAPQGADSKRYKSLFLAHTHNPQVEEIPLPAK
jgi:hypothetical protein